MILYLAQFKVTLKMNSDFFLVLQYVINCLGPFSSCFIKTALTNTVSYFSLSLISIIYINKRVGKNPSKYVCRCYYY